MPRGRKVVEKEAVDTNAHRALTALIPELEKVRTGLHHT
jgi:hypothetical protein